MIKQCLDVIEKDQTIYRVEHILPEIPFGKTWFYHHKLNEVNDIKNALDLNRIKEKKRTNRGVIVLVNISKAIEKSRMHIK